MSWKNQSWAWKSSGKVLEQFFMYSIMFKPLHFQDFFSSSPYCLHTILMRLVWRIWDKIKTVFVILITRLLDTVMIS